MRQKGFAPILIFVVIGVLGVVLYFGLSFIKSSEKLPIISPIPLATPETTVGWKTYTNKYFYIKYPTNAKAVVWSLAQLSEESNMNLNENFKNLYHETPPTILSSLKLESETFNIWIYVFENKNNLSAEQWSQKNDYYPENFTEPKDQSDRKTVYMGGSEAKMGTPFGVLYSEAYLIPFSDKMFLVYTHPMEQKVLVDQILSTFKFAE